MFCNSLELVKCEDRFSAFWRIAKPHTFIEVARQSIFSIKQQQYHVTKSSPAGICIMNNDKKKD